MPLIGTRQIGDIEGPEVPSFATEAVTLPKARLVQALFEVPSEAMEDMVPPALHPTIPPTLHVVALDAPSSPWGPFTMAQARVGARAGVRPRGLGLVAVVSTREAADALASGWGYSTVVGEARLSPRYHEWQATAALAGGHQILDLTITDLEPGAGTDVQFVASMNPARTPSGVRLVQVDVELTFHRADRGRPRLDVFDGAGFGDERMVPVHPVSAFATTADVTLTGLRYVSRPDVPALQGTERVNG
jgi:hypothetical protein